MSSEWVWAYIHGHGALGELYPDYDGGDIWRQALGRVRGIKEGGTPKYLGLIPNGLNDPDELDWGGRFEGAGTRHTDALDAYPGMEGDMDARIAVLYRWREGFQNDFAARLDWCVKPPGEANHPPVERLEPPPVRFAHLGERMTLDASASDDPDGDELSFHWFAYPEVGSYKGKVPVEGENSPRVSFVMPEDALSRSVHLVLEVTDDGAPPLTRYARGVVVGSRSEEEVVQYTRSGRTGLKVNRLCLGTMNSGTRTSEEEGFAIMDSALEHAITFFDTADRYGREVGLGHTGELIGRWLTQRGRRERVVLETKVYGAMGEGPNARDGPLRRGLRQLVAVWPGPVEVPEVYAWLELPNGSAAATGLLPTRLGADAS